MIAPGPAASASAEPLMPEKNVIVRMFVCPRPPRKRPTNCDAKRSSTSDSAPPVISSAVRMKNGTAISANTSMPLNRYFGSAISGRPPWTTIAASVPPPSANATGTPSASSTMQATNSVGDHSFTASASNSASARKRRCRTYGRRHQQQVDDHQREADRHREIDGADRDLQHRRRLAPREHRVAHAEPHHRREEAEQQRRRSRARIHGAVPRQRVLQRVDADVRRRSAARGPRRGT